jgi:hypothetical protein
MRSGWLILVGITALACKDEPATPLPASSGPGSARSSSLVVSAQAVSPPATPDPKRPNLPDEASVETTREFETEAEDLVWAGQQERSLKKLAPDLASVTCRQKQCRAVVTAATEEELVRRIDRLQQEDMLPSTNAANVLLTAPAKANGTSSVTIYVRYNR